MAVCQKAGEGLKPPLNQVSCLNSIDEQRSTKMSGVGDEAQAQAFIVVDLDPDRPLASTSTSKLL